ncbi:MAG TPA: SDR family oxidoreductase [Candidatus Acidoferrum sp.]|jgi:nucleoside-diphosphate-sugar epimerase|nr:SDR family oxidoreductase [Candidatus Acidoferrum sp.]
MRTLIVGCGYVGLQLGRDLVLQGHEVWGLCRSAATITALETAGLVPVEADITRPETLTAVSPRFDFVVFCASATGGGPERYREVYVDGLRNLLASLTRTPSQRFVYTSSTSVYGQTDGSLVDETSPAKPTEEIGRILLEAEEILLTAARERQYPAVVLRAAGIYGPGRGYWLQQYLKGEATLQGRGERVLNMVHRDDVAGATIAALQRGHPGEIYNVVDNGPVSQRGLFEWLSKRLGRPMPPCVPESGTESRKRGATSKRVSNHKLRFELQYRLKYSTFREGFESELEQDGKAAV